MLQKISGIEKRQGEERGGHHDFPSKICCLTIPKNSVGETCVSERFWYRKILWMRRGAGEYHDFQMEILCLTEPKNFVEEPFCVAENFWYRKISRRRDRERGASRLSFENLLSHRTEQLRRGNLCFRKFLVSKNVKDKRERGASRLSVETLLSHSTEKLCRGNLCFRKVLVSKNVKDKRERGHLDFPSKLCCLTVPKNFVGQFCVSEKFWYRKLLRIRERGGGGASRLSIENLLSHNTEILRRGNLCFRKVLVSQNFMDERGR